MLARELLRVALILASLVPASLVIAALFVSRRSPFGAALRVTSLTVKISLAAVTLRCLAALFSWIGYEPQNVLPRADAGHHFFVADRSGGR